MEIILGIACILLLLLCLTLGSVCGQLSAQKEQIKAMEKTVENYKAELKRTYEKNKDLYAENLALQRRQNAASEAWSAALATAYSTEIGTVFEAELKNGTKLLIICADFKNPLEEANEPIYGTPCTNYDDQDAVCLFEFVVDWTKLPRIVKDAGTFTVLPQFGGLYGDGGNVVKLTKLGRWWKP